MPEQIKMMNEEELLSTFKELNVTQEHLRRIYEEVFGDRINEVITSQDDISLYERIKENLEGVLLAKHYVTERLSSEFKIFVM